MRSYVSHPSHKPCTWSPTLLGQVRDEQRERLTHVCNEHVFWLIVLFCKLQNPFINSAYPHVSQIYMSKTIIRDTHIYIYVYTHTHERRNAHILTHTAHIVVGDTRRLCHSPHCTHYVLLEIKVKYIQVYHGALCLALESHCVSQAIVVPRWFICVIVWH